MLGTASTRLAFRAFAIPFALVLLVALAFTACADNGDPDVQPVADAGHADAPVIDAGGGGGGDGGQDSSSDSQAPVTDTGTSTPDTGPPDTTPPGKITDLAGTPKSYSAVDLTWTAPPDNPVALTGTVAGYELRYATTAITNVTEFLAATLATPPAPMAPQTPQTATVSNLLPSTGYHFVIRSRDVAGNFSDLSNDVLVTTKARAKLVITEVAIANTTAEGFDFIEAVVTQPGSVDGIQFKQFGTLLYSLANVELAVDDRIVVHAAGAALPTGAANEDTTKNKTLSTAASASVNAYDVYATLDGLQGTDNLITINDSTSAVPVVDAIAISNRDNDAAAATMTAWAGAKTATAWTFSVTPTDATNDCESQRDAVNVATAQQDLACGGFATGYTKGQSLNRVVGADTNSKADWYIAGQTPGELNAAPTTFTALSAIAKSATSVEVTFDQEIASATATAAAFTIAPALNVTAATTTNVNVVTLTTAAQAGGAYDLAVASTLKSIAGTSMLPPSIRFCSFTALPALVSLNEVSPDLDLGADLIELKVTRDGALVSYEVRSNPTAAATPGTLLATLPAICGVAGDIIVVHLAPVASSSTEFLSKTEGPHGTFVANYDSAYDVRGSNTGLGFTNQVLAVRDASGAFIDAAAFSTMTPAASSAAYLGSVPFIQGLGLWLPANCGGATCTDASAPTIKGIAANWNGVSGDDPGNPSISRTNTANQASSWVVGPSTFGN